MSDQREKTTRGARHLPVRGWTSWARRPSSRARTREGSFRGAGAGLEIYPGAGVLDDLSAEGRAITTSAAHAIIARFATLQLTLIADLGLIADRTLTADSGLTADTCAIDEPEIGTEINLARSYLDDESIFEPGECAALGEILDEVPALVSGVPNRRMARALISAGAGAEAWGHLSGARAYYEFAGELAEREGWARELTGAADALAGLGARPVSPPPPLH